MISDASKHEKDIQKRDQEMVSFGLCMGDLNYSVDCRLLMKALKLSAYLSVILTLSMCWVVACVSGPGEGVKK